jgi:hypothetical protein
MPRPVEVNPRMSVREINSELDRVTHAAARQMAEKQRGRELTGRTMAATRGLLKKTSPNALWPSSRCAAARCGVCAEDGPTAACAMNVFAVRVGGGAAAACPFAATGLRGNREKEGERGRKEERDWMRGLLARERLALSRALPPAPSPIPRARARLPHASTLARLFASCASPATTRTRRACAANHGLSLAISLPICSPQSLPDCSLPPPPAHPPNRSQCAQALLLLRGGQALLAQVRRGAARARR